MAAGDLYRALAMNQNLEPTARNIQSFFDARQKRKDLEDFWNYYKQAKQNVEGAASPTGEWAGIPYRADVQKQRFDPVKAQGMISDTTMNALQRFPDVNPEYVNLANSLLQRSVEARTPTYTTKEFDPTKGLEQITQIPGQAPSFQTLRAGEPRTKLGIPTEITANEDDPNGRYKKGDTIRIAIDESSYPPKQMFIGMADTTTKDIARKRLGLESKRVELERQRLNKEKNQDDPEVVKQNIALIDQQLQDVNPTEPLFGQLTRLKLTEQMKLNKAQSKQSGSEKGLSKNQFIKNFKQDYGKNPSESELTKAKQKGYWK